MPCVFLSVSNDFKERYTVFVRVGEVNIRNVHINVNTKCTFSFRRRKKNRRERRFNWGGRDLKNTKFSVNNDTNYPAYVIINRQSFIIRV